MRKIKGFTLLELMIVVVILGILVGVALPQYTKTVERSRQNEAVQLLGAIRGAEERVKYESATYTSSLTSLDIDAPPTSTTGPNYFTYAITSATATAFTATATRTDYKKPSDVTAYTVTIDQAGTITKGF